MRRNTLRKHTGNFPLHIDRLEERAVPSVFSVLNTNDTGAGSLRQAILDANANPGTDSIIFSIPGSGQQTIRPGSLLPTITDAVMLDGFTQAGSRANTNGPGQAPNAVWNVVVDGSTLLGYNTSSLLTISAGQSTIRGLTITGFNGGGLALSTNGNNIVAGNQIVGNGRGNITVQSGDGNQIGGTLPADVNLATTIAVASNNNLVQGNQTNGISVTGNGNTIGGTSAAARNTANGNLHYGISIAGANNVVQGNYVGTDVTGMTAVRNRTAGIFVTGSGNTIGGTDPGAGNLVSGNGRGVYLFGGSGNNVLGNRIGLNAQGGVLGNGGEGILITNGASNNLIGGTSAAAGNVVAGNGTGITLFLGATGNTIQGNRIGTLADGTTAAGNLFAGIYVSSSAANNTIGGTAAGAGNRIVNTVGIAGNTNSGNGVFIEALVGVPAPSGIAILGNSIDNNAGRGILLQAGTNNNQVAPTLVSATTANMMTTVTGIARGPANTTVRVEIFASPVGDPSGFGEGRTFLGFVNVAIGASGSASFTARVLPVAAGQAISATATDYRGNTSAFAKTIKSTGSMFFGGFVAMPSASAPSAATSAAGSSSSSSAPVTVATPQTTQETSPGSTRTRGRNAAAATDLVDDVLSDWF